MFYRDESSFSKSQEKINRASPFIRDDSVSVEYLLLDMLAEFQNLERGQESVQLSKTIL